MVGPVGVVSIESGVNDRQVVGDGSEGWATLQQIWQGELAAAREAGTPAAVPSEGAPVILAQRGPPLQPPGPLAPSGQSPRGAPADPVDLAGPHVRRVQIDQYMLGFGRLDRENDEMRQKLGMTGPSLRPDLQSMFGHLNRGGMPTHEDVANARSLWESASSENLRLRQMIESPEGQRRIELQAQSEQRQREIELSRERFPRLK